MNVVTIVGTRPNFVKTAPLHRALRARPGIRSTLIHTGQHHDACMSDVFFRQLDLPTPDYSLGVETGSITQQTADIMQRLEPILLRERPDWVIVVGDVTSTLAGALVANRLGIRIAHVEAGLRAGDRSMPEEINRTLTDRLSDCLFVTEPAGLTNLRQEGIASEKIHFVGNILIDALRRHWEQATRLNAVGALGLQPRHYILMTMHRPANVDTLTGLQRLVALVAGAARYQTVLLPLHPRTRIQLTQQNLLPALKAIKNVRLLAPQGYLEFVNLMDQATLVITDSGGVQEETTYLGVPCLTFRQSTERPVTVELGTNQLIADLNPETARQKLTKVLAQGRTTGQIPPF